MVTGMMAVPVAFTWLLSPNLYMLLLSDVAIDAESDGARLLRYLQKVVG